MPFQSLVRSSRKRNGTLVSSVATTATLKRKKVPSILVLLVVFGALLLYQGSRPLKHQSSSPHSTTSFSDFDLLHVLSSYSPGASTIAGVQGPLGIPAGEAPTVPGARVVDPAVESRRQEGRYGGLGDSAHLGGFFAGLDISGLSPMVWRRMVQTYNVKSVLELGCGRAYATAWFETHGLKARGVDGSADAIAHSAIPAERRSQILVEHDFARGPW